MITYMIIPVHTYAHCAHMYNHMMYKKKDKYYNIKFIILNFYCFLNI